MKVKDGVRVQIWLTEKVAQALEVKAAQEKVGKSKVIENLLKAEIKKAA